MRQGRSGCGGVCGRGAAAVDVAAAGARQMWGCLWQLLGGCGCVVEHTFASKSACFAYAKAQFAKTRLRAAL